MSGVNPLVAGLAVLGLNGIQCGPTGAEAAHAVLAAAPIVFGVGVGLSHIVFLLWRRFEPTLIFRIRPHAIIVAALFLVGVVAALWGRRVGRWFLMALWAFGTSYLALLLVTLRVWWWRSKSRELTWAPMVPLVVLLAPAGPLAFGLGEYGVVQNVAAILWLFPGYGGIVPGVLAGILLVEVAILKTRRPIR